MDSLLGTNVSSKWMTPAFYRVPISQIAISGAGSATLITDGDSVFKLFYFQGSSDLDAATDVSPNNFTVQVKLNNGRLLTNDPIPQRILCPTQQFIITEPYQVEFPGNTQIQFNFVNLSAASVINIDLVLRGVKIYGP